MYQSAIAIATAHIHGFFHYDVRPKNILYNGSSIKLINFDSYDLMDDESIINKFLLKTPAQRREIALAYLPPELKYHKAVKGLLSISAKKIDSYCWGMSMLQFLTKMSDSELTDKIKRIRENRTDLPKFLSEMMTFKIPELDAKSHQCVMRLLSGCLEYSPCMRRDMEDVITCLGYPNEQFSEIFKYLTKEMEEEYTSTICDLVAQFNLVPKSIAKQDLRDANLINKLEEPKEKSSSIDKAMIMLLEKKKAIDRGDVYSDPLFQKIAIYKDEIIQIKRICTILIDRKII